MKQSGLKHLFAGLTLLMVGLVACSSSPKEVEEDSDAVCFIGDSIVYLWDLEEYFPGLEIIKRAICGAVVEDVDDWDVGQCKGKRTVYLMGTNNIWGILSNLDGIEDIREGYGDLFVRQVSKLRAKPLLYISILPRNGNYVQDTLVTDNIRQQNKVVVRKLDSLGLNYHYIDVFDDFIEKGNVIDTTLFEDGLHPSAKGYEIIANKLKPYLE